MRDALDILHREHRLGGLLLGAGLIGVSVGRGLFARGLGLGTAAVGAGLLVRQALPCQRLDAPSFATAPQGARPGATAPTPPHAGTSRSGGRTDGRPDEVAEASDESFPASDPPAWTGAHA